MARELRAMETTCVAGDTVVAGDYIVDGHLEISGSLVVTGSMRVAGRILGLAVGSIKAGGSIEAGGSIKAGDDFGIYAGLHVRLSLKSQYGLVLAKSEPSNIQTGIFKVAVDYGWAWHVHHINKLAERLTEPIENRIAYIKERKPEHERETRLRLLKPIAGPMPENITKAAMEALHAKECPDCPWNGHTIFP